MQRIIQSQSSRDLAFLKRRVWLAGSPKGHAVGTSGLGNIGRKPDGIAGVEECK